MTNYTRLHPLSDYDSALIERITQRVTPSAAEVADWHYTDAILERDWSRPLVSILRFFVGPVAPLAEKASDMAPPEIDLVTSVLTPSALEGPALVA